MVCIPVLAAAVLYEMSTPAWLAINKKKELNVVFSQVNTEWAAINKKSHLMFCYRKVILKGLILHRSILVETASVRHN